MIKFVIASGCCTNDYDVSRDIDWTTGGLLQHSTFKNNCYYYFRERPARLIEDEAFRLNAFKIIMEMMELSLEHHTILVDEVRLMGTALLCKNVYVHIVTLCCVMCSDNRFCTASSFWDRSALHVIPQKTLWIMIKACWMHWGTTTPVLLVAIPLNYLRGVHFHVCWIW